MSGGSGGEGCALFLDDRSLGTQLLALTASENLSDSPGLTTVSPAHCELIKFFAKKEYDLAFDNFVRDIISVPIGFGVGSLVARASSLESYC